VHQGITYWSGDGTDLKLDACQPVAAKAPTPAVVIVHGGGFTDGDRAGAGMRALCVQTARLGASAFSIDYRLAPAFRYPAQVEDLANAVRWLRDPGQVQRFGIDPAKIGVIGSSAGAIIAQSLATQGSGPLDTDARVAAVVSLSGVSVMTAEGLQLGRPSEEAQKLVLGYLGCTSPAQCPQSTAASPVSSVDPSDPPMLLVNGTGELVPQEQAEAMDAALRAAGVPDELLVVKAAKHGASLLNAQVRKRLTSFLNKYL
jgi:acetyl esterase/lipase